MNGNEPLFSRTYLEPAVKVNRPPSFIPYGPHGRADAKFHFEYEGQELEQVTARFWWKRPDLPVETVKPGHFDGERESLAEDGYFIVPVVDNAVPSEYASKMQVPLKFTPAAAGTKGRRLEDFPYAVAGYYQHYTYEPFTNEHPGCDHDFGLEAVEYVFKVQATGEQIPLEHVIARPRDDGKIYLTVKCTRCGDVHAIEQVTASGEVEFC